MIVTFHPWRPPGYDFMHFLSKGYCLEKTKLVVQLYLTPGLSFYNFFL
jgi:hypothetical protein